jgi:lysozyme
MNTILPETIALIKRWEMFMPKPYVDNGGPLAIGYGHQSQAGPPEVVEGMEITETQATEILMGDLERFSVYMMKDVKTPLNDYQYGACLSLVFNRGPGTFRRSKVLEYINTPGKYHMEKAAAAFLELNTARDKITGETRPFLGLTCRRITEAALFLKRDK